MTEKQSQGLTEALRALGRPQRKPTGSDRPPPQPLPGRKPIRIAGQLELGETTNINPKGATR